MGPDREELLGGRKFIVPIHAEFGSERALFCGFLLGCDFADFFTLFQRFSFVKAKYITYVQDELFSGLKLTNLDKIFTVRLITLNVRRPGVLATPFSMWPNL